LATVSAVAEFNTDLPDTEKLVAKTEPDFASVGSYDV